MRLKAVPLWSSSTDSAIKGALTGSQSEWDMDKRMIEGSRNIQDLAKMMEATPAMVRRYESTSRGFLPKESEILPVITCRAEERAICMPVSVPSTDIDAPRLRTYGCQITSYMFQPVSDTTSLMARAGMFPRRAKIFLSLFLKFLPCHRSEEGLPKPSRLGVSLIKISHWEYCPEIEF